MDQTLKTKLDDAQQDLLKTYEMALSHGDAESQKENLYLEMLEDLLRMRNNANRSEEALNKAKEQSTVEAFQIEYKKLKTCSFNPKKTDEYKAFRTQLAQIKEAFDNQSSSQTASTNNRVECDEFIMETDIQINDPLTKRKMENPVKNIKCGHHYEKSAILEAIRINRRLRCPVAGCGNNVFVQTDHLVDDNALKLRIRNMENENDDEEVDPLGF